MIQVGRSNSNLDVLIGLIRGGVVAREAFFPEKGLEAFFLDQAESASSLGFKLFWGEEYAWLDPGVRYRP